MSEGQVKPGEEEGWQGEKFHWATDENECWGKRGESAELLLLPPLDIAQHRLPFLLLHLHELRPTWGSNAVTKKIATRP